MKVDFLKDIKIPADMICRKCKRRITVVVFDGDEYTWGHLNSWIEDDHFAMPDIGILIIVDEVIA